MNLTNFLLKKLSQLSKVLPHHRKLTHFYVSLSKILISLGARPIVIAQMHDGTHIKVDLSTKTERSVFFDGNYDANLIKTIHSIIDVDSVFLDIGANIGFYSVSIGQFFKTNNSKGKLISFEPFEGNYNRLQENIHLNNLKSLCQTNNYGLSNETKELNITLREDFKNGSTTGNASIEINRSYDKDYNTAAIQLKRLDDVIQNHINNEEKIDFIKMDIEGHEDFCLNGAKETISNHRPTILMEVAKPYYVAREVDLDDTFFPLIPEKYAGFVQKDTKWIPFKSLEECIQIDNVFWIPNEKLNSKKYAIFQS